MPNAQQEYFEVAIELSHDWVDFDDGVMLFNPNNGNTVLYHPILKGLKELFGQPNFNLACCLNHTTQCDHQLIMDTLVSLEELGFIYRTGH